MKSGPKVQKSFFYTACELKNVPTPGLDFNKGLRLDATVSFTDLDKLKLVAVRYF